ncbi:MAG: sigma factor-like helix-turn-helix DNA-binding protein [Gemmatimonadales bacterium]
MAVHGRAECRGAALPPPGRRAGGPGLDRRPRGRRGWGEIPEPDVLLERLSNREILERGLAALPPPERETLVLRDLESLSGEQVAELTGVSLAAMKSRLHRARLRFAAAVRELNDG